MSEKTNKTEKKVKKGDYWKDEIVQFLRNHPSGSTITDIAKGIDTSRVTVTKYMSILLQDEKAFAKEVGVYKLYFYIEREFVPVSVLRAFYSGVLEGVKGKLSEKDFKEIGHVVAGYMRPLLRTSLLEDPETLREPTRKSFRGFFEFFKEVYPYMEFVNPEGMNVEMEEMSKTEDKATYIFKNVKLLELSAEFKYHFHLWSGAIETLYSKFFKKQVTCEIIDINVKDLIVKVSLEIH